MHYPRCEQIVRLWRLRQCTDRGPCISTLANGQGEYHRLCVKQVSDISVPEELYSAVERLVSRCSEEDVVNVDVARVSSLV